MAHAGRQVLTNRPERGKRPRNRRQLIIAAAAELFYRRGYDAVSMSDIAEAVAIGPSALYRHFRGKDELLATVIADALGRLDSALQGVQADDDLAAVLAQAGLENRGTGVLWRREARQLTTDGQHRIRAVVRRIREQLSDALRARRPELSLAQADLLGWCALSIANSLSFHNISLPKARFAALLRQLIDAALTAPADSSLAETAGPQRDGRTQIRREEILTAATTLFARKGYPAASMDDIGAAVGLAGHSIYNHFPAKSDILAALMARGNEWLRIELNRALGTPGGPGQILGRVIGSYQHFTQHNPDLVDILLHESAHLPEPEKRRAHDAQRSYIDEWVHLAGGQHPQWSTTEARIRVHACQIMIGNVAVVERLRNMTGMDRVLVRIGEQLLETGDTGGAQP